MSRHVASALPVLLASLALAHQACAGEFAAPVQWGACYGYGDRTNVFGAQLVWDSPWLREQLAPYAIVPRIDASVAAWRARDRSTRYADLAAIGGDAILRYAPAATTALRPFVEGALGIQFLTHTHINTRDLGASFQFASTIAAGFAFGDADAWELSVLLQHVSNGNLAIFNDGFTYAGIRLRRAWR